MQKGNTTPENKDYKLRGYKIKEKKLSSMVIHSVTLAMK